MKVANAGDMTIAYEDTGEGPPLVVLDGWAGSGLTWHPGWIAELERDFRVLRVSNRGTGYSGRVEAPFTMADMAADTVAVLDAEGLEAANLFGLSMGGMIAQTVAVEHPDRVAGLTLAGTAPPVPAMVVGGASLGRLLSRRDPTMTTDEIVARVWENVVGPGFTERGADVLEAMVQGALRKPVALVVIGMQGQAFQSFTGPERLASIRVPTLVIHGADDPLLPVENGRRLHELIPGSRYEELPGVGHLVPYEAPERTAALMREVLLAEVTHGR